MKPLAGLKAKFQIESSSFALAPRYPKSFQSPTECLREQYCHSYCSASLENLHAAHQGTSTMEQRACQIVYWPGMSTDIRAIREQCPNRNRNAPLQAATPPPPTSPPTTPFEEVFADFFDYGGRHYLVVGDRLSGWVEVLSSNSGTNLAGARD